MPVKQDSREGFRQVVGNVDRGINSFKMDKVAFNSIT